MTRYLGNVPDVAIRQVREREPLCFALVDDIANYAGNLVCHLNVPRGEIGHLLAALLCGRVFSAFEAVIALAERGMYTEGHLVRRSQLEALFVLSAIRQQPALAQTYLENDKHRRRDVYKKIKKLSPKLRSNLEPEFAPDVVDSQVAELESAAKGIPYMGVEGWAQAARLHDLYLTDYTFSSEAAHHVAKDLERHVVLDADGDIEALHWGPEQALPSKLLLRSMDYMLMAADSVRAVFSLGGDVEGPVLRARIDHLYQQPRGEQNG